MERSFFGICSLSNEAPNFLFYFFCSKTFYVTVNPSNFYFFLLDFLCLIMNNILHNDGSLKNSLNVLLSLSGFFYMFSANSLGHSPLAITIFLHRNMSIPTRLSFMSKARIIENLLGFKYSFLGESTSFRLSQI